MNMAITFLSQLELLLWKQRRLLRAEFSTLFVTIALPSILLYLASANSGSFSVQNSLDLVECKIDNLLYCNYPMAIRVHGANANAGIDSSFQLAADNVAKTLSGGSLSSDQFFVKESSGVKVERPSKIGGEITIKDSDPNSAKASWYYGSNPSFASRFVELFNAELEAAGSTIQFEDNTENPYEYDSSANNLFDVKVCSFLVLLQSVGNRITAEKTSSMYYYITQAGLLPSVFWIFEYVYWMTIASISIGVTALFAEVVGKEVQIGAYFVSAWWHISVGIFLGSILRTKTFVTIFSFVLLMFGFGIPIVFGLILEQTKTTVNIYDGLKCIPIFFFSGSVTEFQMNVGILVSAAVMVLGAYCVPLFSVNEGVYAGSRVNYLYFLSPKFWTSGIVALPSYDEDEENTASISAEDDDGDGDDVLVFRNCIKRFGDEKVIGPLTLNLKVGNITTLMGPNGVGECIHTCCILVLAPPPNDD